MSKPRFQLLISLILLTSTISSCGPISPPESCGAGGTANEGTFNQHFVEMRLYDETLGGSPRIHTEAGPTFLANSLVSVQAETLMSVEVRFCVEERKGGGEISFDEVRMIPDGDNVISIEVFEPGSYVIRVIQNGVLVRNLPFIVE